MSGSISSNSINYGSDTITLKMAEDQALGVDAQFTVNVDGKQIGGTQTVTASQAAGQTQDFTFAGDYGPGTHNVTVSFVNNFIYPGVAGDRNLYVDGVTYDGQTVSNATTPIYVTAFYPPDSTQGNFYGNAVFQVNDSTAIPAGTGPSQTTTPGPVSIGSGADTLVLNTAEDAYLGDAQFTVSVDGKQIGGTQTTTASVDAGQAQEFDVHGDFGAGGHTVTVDFLNDQIGDLYPGTQWAIDTTDRNLYVMGASLNGGTPASGAPWELSSSGAHDFYVTAGSNPSATASNSGLFGANGAAADGSNIAIPSGSVSSDSMTFLASSTTTSSASTNGTTGTSASTATDTGSGTSSASSLASTVSTVTPSVQDVTAASTPTATITGTDTTATRSGSASMWSGHHHAGHVGAPAHSG